MNVDTTGGGIASLNSASNASSADARLRLLLGPPSLVRADFACTGFAACRRRLGGDYRRRSFFTSETRLSTTLLRSCAAVLPSRRLRGRAASSIVGGHGVCVSARAGVSGAGVALRGSVVSIVASAASRSCRRCGTARALRPCRRRASAPARRPTSARRARAAAGGASAARQRLAPTAAADGPPRRIGLQQLHDDAIERAAVGARLPRDGGANAPCGSTPGRRLVEHDARREQIRTPIDRAAPALLGRHVRQRAEDGRGLGQPRDIGPVSISASRRAMPKSASCAPSAPSSTFAGLRSRWTTPRCVRVRQRGEQPSEDGGGLGGGSGRGDARAQVGAFDQRHREPRRPVLRSVPEHAHDGRMFQARERLDLAGEARDDVRVVGQRRRQELQRDGRRRRARSRGRRFPSRRRPAARRCGSRRRRFRCGRSRARSAGGPRSCPRA